MLVSVEDWSRTAHNGDSVEFVAVQLEHFGFMLSRPQAEEYCRKLSELHDGEVCHTSERDSLFMDMDTTTSDSPFVILANSLDSPRSGWFCDIPEPAANELHRKLKERLIANPRTTKEASHGQEGHRPSDVLGSALGSRDDEMGHVTA
jgi:hypothetical protein